METKEKALLEGIRTIYNKLEQNIHGEYRNLTKIGDPGFCYHTHAQELFYKVLELYNTYHKKNEVCNAISEANQHIKRDLFRLFQQLEELQ